MCTSASALWLTTDWRRQTRTQLLDAAASSIAKRGLAATSVDEIATQAGYTRGAFYSNFKSKRAPYSANRSASIARIFERIYKMLLDASPSSDGLQKAAQLDVV